MPSKKLDLPTPISWPQPFNTARLAMEDADRKRRYAWLSWRRDMVDQGRIVPVSPFIHSKEDLVLNGMFIADAE